MYQFDFLRRTQISHLEVTVMPGDGSTFGRTDEDRFFGVRHYVSSVLSKRKLCHLHVFGPPAVMVDVSCTTRSRTVPLT